MQQGLNGSLWATFDVSVEVGRALKATGLATLDGRVTGPRYAPGFSATDRESKGEGDASPRPCPTIPRRRSIVHGFGSDSSADIPSRSVLPRSVVEATATTR